MAPVMAEYMSEPVPAMTVIPGSPEAKLAWSDRAASLTLVEKPPEREESL